jgi:fructokinase
MTGSGPILCIGEVLWDALPSGLYLGGAPFNAACHLAAMEEPVVFASRVGDDELAREIRVRMKERGVSAEYLQLDGDHPTGFVRVTLDESGIPSYEILQPSAWDAIEMTEDLRTVAHQAKAMVFGSLAQRSPVSRATIGATAEIVPYKVLDINLRPPFVEQDVVAASLKLASLVKLNDEELDILAGWFDLGQGGEKQVRALAEKFSCESVCVTKGARGAFLLHGDKFHETPGLKVDVADTVGAGDAFLAGLLSSLLSGASGSDALRRANALGAYVASRAGAIPERDDAAVRRLFDQQQTNTKL